MKDPWTDKVTVLLQVSYETRQNQPDPDGWWSSQKCRNTHIRSLQITTNFLSDELEWMLYTEGWVQLGHLGTDIFTEVFITVHKKKYLTSLVK